nr:hypothetical protein Iba_chr11cCG3340 [Ipomoea batatas]GMD58349.1 hypothetical protein Iba_chr11fCG4730 [Ipomoea batatas]
MVQDLFSNRNIGSKHKLFNHLVSFTNIRHTNIKRVMSFSVNLKFNFSRSKCQRPPINTSLPHYLQECIHIPQICC